MKPVALRISHFGSVLEEQVFEFPDRAGLYFLSGANGSGKSTVWAALTWCLFGKNAKGLKAGDVANWTEPEGASVEFTFDADNDRHRVTRTHAPNSWTLESAGAGYDERPGTSVDLTKDETNPLQSMLQLDYTTWLHTVLLAQDEPMFLDLKPPEKAALFAEVMRLDKWQGYSDNASKKAAVQDAITRKLESEVSELRGKLAGMKAIDYSKQIEEFERERKARLALITGKYEQLLSGTEEREEQHRKNEAGATEYREILRKLIEVRNRAERAAAETRCPTCHGLGTIETRNELADAQEGAEKARSRLQTAEGSLRESRITVEAANRELDRLEDNADSIKEEVNPYEAIASRQMVETRAIQGTARIRERALAESTERFEMLGFWVRGFKDIRLELIAEALDHLEAEVNGCLSQLGLDGWSLTFEVDRETKSGTIARGFNVFVQGPANDRQVPWESWSGGEAQRLRVAAQMGLANLIRSSTGASIALEVWDEPSNGLEAQGIDDLLVALSRRAQEEQRQIWVTDHRVLGSSAFDGTVTVNKDSEGTHYEAVQ